jgi:hypothetical protein
MLIDFRILPPTLAEGAQSVAEMRGVGTAGVHPGYPRYQSWWIFLWQEVAKSSGALSERRRVRGASANGYSESTFRTDASVRVFAVVDPASGFFLIATPRS